jgi:hypothetical protein
VAPYGGGLAGDGNESQRSEAGTRALTHSARARGLQGAEWREPLELPMRIVEYSPLASPSLLPGIPLGQGLARYSCWTNAVTRAPIAATLPDLARSQTDDV